MILIVVQNFLFPEGFQVDLVVRQ